MNLLNYLWRSRQPASYHPGPHVTWASRSVSLASRSISQVASRTGVFLRKQLWIWPIIAMLFLSIIGFALRASIVSTMKENLSHELRTVVGLETSMLEAWFRVQKTNAESMANSHAFREVACGLIEANSSNRSESLPSPTAAVVNSQHAQLEKVLAPFLSTHHFGGYFVVDKTTRVIAASQAVLLGQTNVPEYSDALKATLNGDMQVCTPFPS